jgi:hypothetical protein
LLGVAIAGAVCGEEHALGTVLGTECRKGAAVVTGMAVVLCMLACLLG